jgi:3'(2'), 5'-bisphosphate nucleotidase
MGANHRDKGGNGRFAIPSLGWPDQAAARHVAAPSRAWRARLPMTVSLRLLSSAAEAGLELLRIRAEGCDPARKADGSPVSLADIAADRILLRTLSMLGPEWAVISEESADGMNADDGPTIYVDPLDGTVEFLAGRPDFAVCIGLVRGGYPVAGCILAPALRQAWTADGGASAWTLDAALQPVSERRIAVSRPPDGAPFAAVISLSHADPRTRALAAATGATRFEHRGSALKFTAVAEGHAALYPRLGRTMVWDTAAGQAIVEAAGGSVLSVNGERMRVSAEATRDGNAPFVAAADEELARAALAHWPR